MQEVAKRVMGNGEPWIVKKTVLEKEDIGNIAVLLEGVLSGYKRQDLMDPLFYIVRECITNANKANSKRIFFARHNLDIQDSMQYDEAMTAFLEAFHTDRDSFADNMEELGLYSSFILTVQDDSLLIMVRNSGLPNENEIASIRKQIKKAASMHSIADAYMQQDKNDFEGAGLGLLTILLFMRSLGVHEKAFQIQIDREMKETVARLLLPLDTITESQSDELSEKLAKELDKLPVFPENIRKLQNMVQDPDISMHDISALIQQDPALTAEILRMVNSASFMTAQKISDIPQAVAMIGMKGLKNLLYSYGTRHVFEQQYENLEALWEHSFRVASYAWRLAVESGSEKQADEAFTGGMLHDIGKIIMQGAFPEMRKNVDRHLGSNEKDKVLIEKMALGISHARIGSLVTGKWNFPELVVSLIANHHTPQLADDASCALAEIVYTANLLAHAEEKRMSEQTCDLDILKKFGINTTEELTQKSASYAEEYAGSV